MGCFCDRASLICRQHRPCIIPQAVNQSSAPEDGRNYRPKQVELIEIINKSLLLHLVGYLYYWQMGFNSVFKGLIRIFLLYVFIYKVTVSYDCLVGSDQVNLRSFSFV